MNLSDFRKYIKDGKNGFMNRAKLIGILTPINRDWSYILRTLLFCSNTEVIANWYIIQKIDFMLKNPKEMDGFLDYWRKRIWILLKNSLEQRYPRLLGINAKKY